MCCLSDFLTYYWSTLGSLGGVHANGATEYAGNDNVARDRRGRKCGKCDARYFICELEMLCLAYLRVLISEASIALRDISLYTAAHSHTVGTRHAGADLRSGHLCSGR